MKLQINYCESKVLADIFLKFMTNLTITQNINVVIVGMSWHVLSI